MDRPKVELMIRQVLDNFRYQEIPDLVGRMVTISNLEVAPEEILRQCQDGLPTPIQFVHPDLQTRQASIAKRGILDLTYAVDWAEVAAISPGGKPLADSLGLFQDSIEVMVEDDGGWEAAFWEDLIQQKAFVHLLLRTWEQLTPEERERRIKHGVPPDYVAKTFRVMDACLSNSELVSLIKHTDTWF